MKGPECFLLCYHLPSWHPERPQLLVGFTAQRMFGLGDCTPFISSPVHTANGELQMESSAALIADGRLMESLATGRGVK